MPLPSAVYHSRNAQTSNQKFDHEADVIVVGLGGAGAATAITAADNGASVIVLERQPAATLRSNTACPRYLPLPRQDR